MMYFVWGCSLLVELISIYKLVFGCNTKGPYPRKLLVIFSFFFFYTFVRIVFRSGGFLTREAYTYFLLYL
jgi:hypothetical protein